MRNDPEKLHAVLYAGRLRPGPKGCVEIAAPGDGDAELRQSRLYRGSGIDQVFEPLLLDETPDGDDDGYIIRDPQECSSLAPARPRSA